MNNPHEAAARARKVLRVVTYLLLGPLKVDQLRLVMPTLTDAQWEQLAIASGTHPLSAETRAAVLAELNRLSGEIVRVA